MIRKADLLVAFFVKESNDALTVLRNEYTGRGLSERAALDTVVESRDARPYRGRWLFVVYMIGDVASHLHRIA